MVRTPAFHAGNVGFKSRGSHYGWVCLAKRASDLNFLSILEIAYENINRAYDLGLQAKGENNEYTLIHMLVTKALILTSYLLIGEKKDRINETMQIYNQIFVDGKVLLGDDTFQKQELNDVNDFMSYIASRSDGLNLENRTKEYFSEIYYIRYNKNYR